MPLRVLITGGSGFIGTHLAEKLILEGCVVQVLDIVDPKSPVGGVCYVRGDVCDERLIEPLLDRCDAVVHFAAIVSIPLCQDQPVRSYKTNVLSTALLVEKIRERNELRPAPIRLVFASSSAVYGEANLPTCSLKEEQVSAFPISYYGAQKLASEQIIRIFARSTQSPCTVFRFFNVYGFGQDPSSPYSGVISIFSKNISESKPIQIFGDGLQTRDFVSVFDIVRACAFAAQNVGAHSLGNAINLGNGRAISIRSLAQTMMEVSNRAVAVETRPPRGGDIQFSCSDISKAAKVLGWAPRVDFKIGLRDLVPRAD